MTDEQCNKIVKAIERGFSCLALVIALFSLGFAFTSCSIHDIAATTRQIAAKQEPPNGK